MLDGEKIKGLRKGAGLSLRDVADRAWSEHGVSLSHETVRKVEEWITLDLLSSQVTALAGVLNVGASDIHKLEPVRVA